MGSVVLTATVSVDGFIADAEGSIDWHVVGPALHGDFNELARSADTFLYGRVTYEGMAGFWPTADEDPDASAEMTEYAQIARNKPKLVFSDTLEEAGWSTTVIGSERLGETVNELRSRPGTAHLLYASADLAATLVDRDLIDELLLYVNPVVLGAGKPLLPSSDRRLGLRLLESRTYANGVVMVRYAIQPEEER